MKKKYDWKTIYKIRPKKRSHHMKCPPPPPLPPTPKRHQKTPGDLFRAVVAKLLFPNIESILDLDKNVIK